MLKAVGRNKLSHFKPFISSKAMAHLTWFSGLPTEESKGMGHLQTAESLKASLIARCWLLHLLLVLPPNKPASKV